MSRVVFILALLLSVSARAEELRGVEYVRTYDGDTITVNLPGFPKVFGYHLGVRLLGLDTPEIKGQCEEEKGGAIVVREIVRQKVEGATDIVLAKVKRDARFRIDAIVLLDGENLNQYLLDHRLARPYDGKTKRQGWCPMNKEES